MFDEQILTIILGVSMASERILELLKTLFPWLAIQKSVTDDNRERSGNEILRRVLIQVISFLSGWMTAGLVAANANEWICLSGRIGDSKIPAVVIGLLSSAGSVFWTQIVAYSKALKDIKKLQAQDERAVTEKKSDARIRVNKFQARMASIAAEPQPEF